MNTSLIISTTIFIINLILIGFVIFFERKQPSVTWAWVLILTFIPIIGFIIYIFFGQNLTHQKMFNKKIINDKGKEEYIKTLKENYRDSKYLKKYSSLIKMNYKNANAPYTENNKITPFFDGKILFEDIFSEVKKAKKFIHIEFYIFRTDNLGSEFMDLLIEKAKEGVEVKILVDCLGDGISKKYIEKLKSFGGEYAVFFKSFFKYINKRINYRNHRKIIVIDSNVAYLGGFNVGDEYISNDKKIGYWRDTHLKIEGNSINDLESRFILDWTYTVKDYSMSKYRKYLKKLEFKNTLDSLIGVQIVSSGPDLDTEQIRNGYVKIINDAKKNVFLQTPYFVPDDCMLQCLKMAASSGIDVRLMIPGKPDHLFMRWVANSYIGELLESGVKVYLYDNGFIHSKTMVSDCNVASVGTANMDIRSFSLNFETNAFIYNSDIANILENQFLKDMEYCKEISLKEFRERGIVTRFFEAISRLLSPIA
ncbi:cardiolipin synthase [Clostridium fallax]|uniref:Cardiolipin synthase n=1 Tax=Clostridium fallax TaxID=1533 RepID=A0A1M4SGP7_9CLOT|nr:cardiolipin synthase [Clostridium fallax]SHE31167.1 cardiolipin synthase [Clostridium fallax]SQB07815.1 cardiolipin synthase [Clostridium fallax]